MNDRPPPPPVTFHVKTTPLAIWSLVLGIAGLVLSLACVGLLLAIPGVICGHMARSRIKHSSGLLTGGGLATGGLVTGYISIALVVVLVPALVIPNFVKARQVAQTNQCIDNLKMIDAAENQWALEHNKRVGTVPTTADLLPYLKDHHMPVCPDGGTYTISPFGTLPTCSTPGHTLQ